MAQERTRESTVRQLDCSNKAYALEKCLAPRVIPDLIEEVNAHVNLGF